MALPRSPQPLAAETAAASGASRVRGRVAFEKGSKNKQLKMAATAAASHAPQRHRPEPSAAAHRAGRHHLRRTMGGEAGGGKCFPGLKKRGRTGRARGSEEALKRGSLKLDFSVDIPASKGSLRLETPLSCSMELPRGVAKDNPYSRRPPPSGCPSS